MSDKESEREKEEGDDLFGDAEEDALSDVPEPRSGDDENNEDDDDDDDDAGIFNDEEDQPRFGKQDINETVGQRLIEITIPRYPTSHVSKETYLSRVPPFLAFEPQLFDSERFVAEVADEVRSATAEELPQVQLRREHTIRWKYSRDVKNRVIKESNARFVEWDDGTLSLQLGGEMFDIQTQPVQDTYLALSQPRSQILQTTQVLNTSMMFVPTSTKTGIHTKITDQLNKSQMRQTKVGTFATTVDPEEIKRRAEKVEDLKLKEKRRLDAKRRAMEEREGGFTTQPTQSYSAYEAGIEDYEDEEEEEEDDGFVVSDDEDVDDERAKRLAKVKERGQRMYDERDDSEEEQEEEEEEEEEKSRKKRRVIDDEDDE